MTKRSIISLSLDGEWLCLDFVNTIHDRYSEEPYDYLYNYEKILEWSVKLELINSSEKTDLQLQAHQNTSQEKKAYQYIKKAREILYNYFRAIAQNEKPDELSTQNFNILLGDAMSRLQLNLSDKLESQFHWKNTSDLKSPVYPVIKSAYDLLTADSPERIKECDACGWLFLDQSKNRSRKWCSMESCGSNVKAKRYYHRKKSTDGL